MAAHDSAQKNKLYYGDNLQVLREYIPDQSVDLIYLDPPYNFRHDYDDPLQCRSARRAN